MAAAKAASSAAKQAAAQAPWGLSTTVDAGATWFQRRLGHLRGFELMHCQTGHRNGSEHQPGCLASRASTGLAPKFSASSKHSSDLVPQRICCAWAWSVALCCGWPEANLEKYVPGSARLLMSDLTLPHTKPNCTMTWSSPHLRT